MARSRFKSQPRRRLSFKDRESLFGDLSQLYRAYEASADCFKVVSLVGKAGCILQLISSYRRTQSIRGRVTTADLPASSTEAVSRFFGHLDEPLRRMMVALSTVQFFDKPLLQGVIRELNLRSIC